MRVGSVVGSDDGSGVGLGLGSGVGLAVEEQLVSLSGSLTKPSKHSHVYAGPSELS
jgi:hypothetical protein